MSNFTMSMTSPVYVDPATGAAYPITRTAPTSTLAVWLVKHRGTAAAVVIAADRDAAIRLAGGDVFLDSDDVTSARLGIATLGAAPGVVMRLEPPRAAHTVPAAHGPRGPATPAKRNTRQAAIDKRGPTLPESSPLRQALRAAAAAVHMSEEVACRSQAMRAYRLRQALWAAMRRRNIPMEAIAGLSGHHIGTVARVLAGSTGERPDGEFGLAYDAAIARLP